MAFMKQQSLLSLIVVLLFCTSPTETKVVKSVAECSEFFLQRNSPNIPEVLVKGNILNQNRYKTICQTFANEKRFVTLYDTFNKIPVFSASKYRGHSDGERCKKWMIEPELEDINIDQDNMQQAKNLNYIFQAGPSDYKNDQEFDRGHLLPNSYGHTAIDKKSTFTLTNVVPQVHKFNTGSWRNMEQCVRCVLDKYCINNNNQKEGFVVIGAQPSDDTFLKNKINIPKLLWSAFCCYSSSQNKWLASAHWGENVESQNEYLQTMSLEELHSKLGGQFEVFPETQCPLKTTVTELYPELHNTCNCPPPRTTTPVITTPTVTLIPSTIITSSSSRPSTSGHSATTGTSVPPSTPTTLQVTTTTTFSTTTKPQTTTTPLTTTVPKATTTTLKPPTPTTTVTSTISTTTTTTTTTTTSEDGRQNEDEQEENAQNSEPGQNQQLSVPGSGVASGLAGLLAGLLGLFGSLVGVGAIHKPNPYDHFQPKITDIPPKSDEYHLATLSTSVTTPKLSIFTVLTKNPHKTTLISENPLTTKRTTKQSLISTKLPAKNTMAQTTLTPENPHVDITSSPSSAAWTQMTEEGSVNSSPFTIAISSPPHSFEKSGTSGHSEGTAAVTVTAQTLEQNISAKTLPPTYTVSATSHKSQNGASTSSYLPTSSETATTPSLKDCMDRLSRFSLSQRRFLCIRHIYRQGRYLLPIKV